jgi:hypothetical protein
MRRSSIRFLAAAMVCAAALVSMLAETAPLQVTYYYLPG